MDLGFMQTASQGLILLGLILAAVGGYGSYHYGEKIKLEEERKSANVGRLYNKDTTKTTFPQFELGDSGAILLFAGPQGAPLFKFADDNQLIISVENRQVLISATIRNKKGDVVAEITKNEWKLNPNNIWDRNYSSNALEIKNPAGEVILQIKLVDERIQFQGKLYDSEGNGVAFGKGLGPEGWGGMIEITDPKHPDLEMKIEPIFKYPSQLHFGELNDNKA